MILSALLPLSRFTLPAVAGIAIACVAPGFAAAGRQSIAHRGASGQAPEHSRAAYELALRQGADFVEPDLAVTRDGVLICLHDDTLERTSNVAEVYPDRFTRRAIIQRPGRHWIANDFTLDEIRRLDTGAWFDSRFAGQQIVTFQEAIDLVRGKAGLYPELKSPPLYTGRGVDMVRLFVAQVKKNGLDTPESLRTTPIIVQSFDESTVRRLARELPTVPRILLMEKFDPGGMSDARLRDIRSFASGIGPEKRLVAAHPDVVARAHAAGLTVTAWTFAAKDVTGYPDVKAEMASYLDDYGIDALFTNDPDQFPH